MRRLKGKSEDAGWAEAWMAIRWSARSPDARPVRNRRAPVDGANWLPLTPPYSAASMAFAYRIGSFWHSIQFARR